MIKNHPLAFSTYLGDEHNYKKTELNALKRLFKRDYVGSFSSMREALDHFKLKDEPGYSAESQLNSLYFAPFDDELTIHIFEWK